ncbi:uncharacterized protein LOC124816671 [Hydra vulgaris]|uniref:uncharacterized protein LOC124816671 n=1 Tax=Hydra vulgaris TaxID=6087 RepID=UPI0032EA3A2B
MTSIKAFSKKHLKDVEIGRIIEAADQGESHRSIGKHFLRLVESTRSTIEPSSPGTVVSSSSASSGPCTSFTISSCSSSTTVPPAQPSAELTYEAYRIYRTQHLGPTSNKSYLLDPVGGKDDPLFRWRYYSPNRGAGDSSRGTASGRGKRGRQKWSGGSHYVNFNINN